MMPRRVGRPTYYDPFDVYWQLKAIQDRTGFGPSLREAEHETGISRSTLEDIYNQLEAAGWIAWDRRKGGIRCLVE